MGAMADLGVHKTDLIQYLTGQYVTEVSAKVITLDKRYSTGELISVDDNAFCIYKMNDGVVGTMCASWTYYGAEDNSTVLYGTKGIMRIYDDPDYSITITKSNGERVLYDIDKIQTMIIKQNQVLSICLLSALKVIPNRLSRQKVYCRQCVLCSRQLNPQIRERRL